MLDEIQAYGWALQVLFIVIGTLLLRFVAVRFLEQLAKRLHHNNVHWDDALLGAGKPAITWLIVVVGLSFAATIVNDYMPYTLYSDDIVRVARELAIILLAVIFFIRLIGAVEQAKVDHLKAAPADEGRLDVTTIVALAKLLRLSVIITGVLLALPAMGIEITALLAAGGVGGIAIGFAARDLLANFFGGLMIFLDRPFAIGDWIRSPDREIEGTVERIGWRLTVVRTFDKRPLYIPNSIFTNIALENPARMSNRRIKENIGIRYKDSAKMAGIIKDVREMLEQHPEIDADQTLIVNFNTYAASALEFFIYTFTRTTNWVKYHEVKQDVLLKIVEIVHAHGADFAFPTTTLDGLEPLFVREGDA